MKRGLLVSFYIIAIVLLASFVVSGCSAVGAMPTVKYCDHVKYERNGNLANIEAKGCVLPRGTDLPGI